MISPVWEVSFILNLYEGKGETLGGPDLTDQVMLTDQVWLLEWVLDSFICEMVNINETQFSFVLDKGTTDTIFIVCQL